jgi:O-antigen ligase
MAVGALLLSPHRGRVLALAGGLAVGTLLVFVTLSSVLPQRTAVRFAGLVDAAGDALDEAPSSPLPGEDPEDPEDRPSSIAQRAGLYRFAFELFVERPVIGVGTSGFEVRFRAEPGVAGHRYPHNLPLQLASEFGILGLALAGALGVLPLLTWRPRTSVSVALAALFAFLLLNAMLSNGLYENRMLWGVWLVLLAYRAPASPAEDPPAEAAPGMLAAAR